MSVITLLRHAPTVASVAGLASGRCSLDMPIAPGSERPATIDVSEFSVVVTSRYRRTKDTADLLGVELERRIESASIDEPDYGQFDGGPWEEFGGWARTHGLHTVAPSAQSSWLDQLRRAVTWLAEPSTWQRTADEPLVVCHGYLWAATQRFTAESLIPEISNIYSPPYLTPLRVDKSEFRRFAAALESGRSAVSPWSGG